MRLILTIILIGGLVTTETNSPTSSPQRDDRQAINKLTEE
jgi:hypothetical protein